jgi:hypothetical protein
MLTVKERGQFVATMRYVQVWLMETLARWVPTTPEMEVKLLFGEHIWDAAQHADALGKRTFELRLPLQHSLRPSDAYAALLDEVAAIEPTPQRITAVYDVLLPALAARYRRYLEHTDTLSDAPTVRILERDLADITRMIETCRSLRQELPDLESRDGAWTASLQAREAAIERISTALDGAVAVEA